VEGLQPELFNPVTGEIRTLATWQKVDGGTRVRFMVNDLADGVFIVFRQAAATPNVTDIDGALGLFLDEHGQLLACGNTSGEYPMRLSDGTQRTVKVAAHSSTIDLQPHGAPDAKGLQSYRATFECSGDMIKHPRLRLDLGKVGIMASGTLNGQPLETRWMPPFAWNIHSLAKPGKNELEITVSPLNQDSPASIKGPVELKWEDISWPGQTSP
ncbi:MAG TPA: hypothetical protein VJ952_09800, partial [Opitutales bacterium]|nr:hypothetical protein [Opitutales bacterium]